MRKCRSIKRYKSIFVCISIICLSVAIYQHFPLTRLRDFIFETTIDIESIHVSTDKQRLLLVTSEESKITVPVPNLKNNISIYKLKGFDQCMPLKESELQKVVLTALENDQQFIYVNLKPDKKLHKYLSRFFYSQMVFVLKYVGTSQTPLANHFLTLPNPKNLSVSELSYRRGRWKRPSIQKILYKNEMQATGQFGTKEPPGLIDPKAPSLILDENVFVSFSMDNILFHYDAFWAMIQFTDYRIWSIWVQRLLQEIDDKVAFITVNNAMNLCPNDNSGNDVSKILATWKCINRTDFFTCVQLLTEFMLHRQILTNEMAGNIKEWLTLLTKSGYKKPQLVNEITSKNYINKVLYVPTINNVDQNLNKLFEHVCKKPIGSCPGSIKSFKRISEILLVIVFNQGRHYDAVDYLIRIYQPTFTHILICGPTYENFEKAFISLVYPVSFIEMPTNLYSHGELSSLCVQSAIRMNYDIDGYFHVGDDVLLNVWNVPKFPTNQIWFQEMLRPANITQPTVPDVWKNKHWGPWPMRRGRKVLFQLMKDLQKLAENDDTIKNYLSLLAKNAGGVDKGFYAVSDIYYIPREFGKLYAFLSEMTVQRGIYNEIGVPTIISGLSPMQEIVRVPGSYLWYYERVLYPQYYDVHHLYLHAIKKGMCLPDKNCTTFLCTSYFPCLNLNGSG